MIGRRRPRVVRRDRGRRHRPACGARRVRCRTTGDPRAPARRTAGPSADRGSRRSPWSGTASRRTRRRPGSPGRTRSPRVAGDPHTPADPVGLAQHLHGEFRIRGGDEVAPRSGPRAVSVAPRHATSRKPATWFGPAHHGFAIRATHHCTDHPPYRSSGPRLPCRSARHAPTTYSRAAGSRSRQRRRPPSTRRRAHARLVEHAGRSAPHHGGPGKPGEPHTRSVCSGASSNARV